MILTVSSMKANREWEESKNFDVGVIAKDKLWWVATQREFYVCFC